ncbi:DUF2867 domain-containing protein [Streptomyces sp. NBC_00096]|uniref:DUF2867 domain-containing protein n=1 Tax=Streptomyces sp. NBC_00096 TaxID=2975650 RepID=UPI003863314D
MCPRVRIPSAPQPSRTWSSARHCLIGQRALFHPHGLLGRAHWWSIPPFRAIVFGGMARNIARTAERTGGRADGRTVRCGRSGRGAAGCPPGRPCAARPPRRRWCPPRRGR